MVILAEPGVQLQIVAHVVHPAHVPLEVEAKAADVGGAADHGPGGGFLGDHHDAGLHGKGHGVELPEEVDGLQVFVPAVLVGGPGPALAAVIEVEHGGHRVHPEAVDVALLQPEAGGGEEEALYLGPSVVEDPGAPGGVLPLVGVAVLIAAAAVELIEPVGVLAEVGGDPVQDNGDAVFVHVVYEPEEVLGGAVPGGGGEVAGALIAPGAVEGMLQHGQQLNGGIAHLLDVGGELFGHVLVIVKIPVGPLLPGAQVDLVDVQGGLVDLVLFLLGQESGVGPLEILNVIELSGGGGAGLAVEGVGVRLQPDLPVGAGDGVFVGRVFPKAGDEALPDLAVPGQGVDAVCPAVEVAHDADALGVRGPDPEGPAFRAVFLIGVGAEPAPAVRQGSGVEAFGVIVFCHSQPPCIAAGPLQTRSCRL